MDTLTFEPIYRRELLHLVNPRGDVGLLTFWSPFRSVKRKLDELSPGILDPGSSRIAVVANLYGDGMLEMFCNLLYNPQIRHLVGIGEELGLTTREQIEAFLRQGLEDAELLGLPVARVPGTDRVFPAVPGFDASRLRRRLSFRYLGKLNDPGIGDELTGCLDELPRANGAGAEQRLRVEIPSPAGDDYSRRPSQRSGHTVIRAHPIDCWEELIVRTVRFGRPVELSKGMRLELIDAKAVITAPKVESPQILASLGFDLDRFLAYQEGILQPQLPDGISYTYGNRLRGRFPQGGGSTDALQTAIEALREDPESRRAYVSLWDTAHDLPEPGGSSRPCLTTLFFRRVEAGRLALAASYRSHNLLSAWLENVYGLMAIQSHVARGAGMETGPITVLSNSLGIDPASPRYALARKIEAEWKTDDAVDRESGKFALREDPNGYFVVRVDRRKGRILAEHRFGGVLIKRYESDRAAKIERRVAADMAVSLVSHALWLGRELAAKEQELQAGRGADDG